ncbi:MULTISPECIES: ABC transporter ATP-binding protein [unclassified Clostridioides]|uniref:ABC transporter ATP-binding protein n=1 Tax=unclassified Clostridioides TaxID=2635829 RepID=UPI001D11C963|nr:ABC transporter ATP-binding protein [Clostridioides sp. ES-S-0171-01]MCC0689734.1 ABC transporter ATP-binding protein [Clostridioides sp. ES-S-0056-01]MCC0715094.1 ABC transporter ATP-binding protein [Clostridioides sp. ES-S-0077-01]UDN54229.1 ABC transporter ATP-binding protein [Clostridioides sp. ES-S-0054-01]
MKNIELKEINHYYGKEKVLHDVNISIKEGEFFTLLGPSGCGKTTILRIIGGFIKPSSGSIYVGDKNITNLEPENRNMGTVFQNYALFPNMTVEENISYGLKIKKLSKKIIMEKCDTYLELAGMKEFRRKKIDELSGGQQQRVAVARALATEPTMLLLDEPMSNLDVALRVKMREEIREIQQKIGITTLFITHDQQEALAISDRIAVMDKGKVLQIGMPMEVYKSPLNDFVANFVGTSNCIEKEDYVNFNIEKETRSYIYKRPEEMILLQNTDQSGFVKVKIESKNFLGPILEYTVSNNGKKYQVTELNRLNNSNKLNVGDRAYLGVLQGE